MRTISSTLMTRKKAKRRKLAMPVRQRLRKRREEAMYDGGNEVYCMREATFMLFNAMYVERKVLNAMRQYLLCSPSSCSPLLFGILQTYGIDGLLSMPVITSKPVTSPVSLTFLNQMGKKEKKFERILKTSHIPTFVLNGKMLVLHGHLLLVKNIT
ncbi:hypothetical protein BC829DRAFT_12862 [Chytridium lagenaria]|nr:hypothetical protein BC829DRAFT_12862 [Chytridium lagenaria]